jgi:hypothetical protein
MQTNHVIGEGACVYSVAATSGFSAETLWNHPSNAALKSKRINPLVLLAGDILHLPEKQLKTSAKSSGSRHKFRKGGTIVKLRLRLLFDEKPRADLPYRIETGFISLTGTTDSKGFIEHSIPANLTDAKLFIGQGSEEYSLKIGYLDPVHETSGVKCRLINLGYHSDRTANCELEDIKSALLAFQEDQGLPMTGLVDEVTKARLAELHGS